MTKDIDKINSDYTFKLTSIGDDSWQLFVNKVGDSSDYVRVVYGITEQIGGSTRTFQVLRSYILIPQTNYDPVFMYQFKEYTMKNRRVWVAFETVKRVKGKKGVGTGTYIALSPVQSKWKTAIGSTTLLEIKVLKGEHFRQLFSNDRQLDQSVYALLET